MLFSCLFLFFNFISPKHCWHFLSFLNTVTISRNLWEFVLDLSETSRGFITNPNILPTNGIPVSHLLRIKDHWIREANLPFWNILTLSNYPRYCDRLSVWMLRQQINYFIRVKCCITLEEIFKYLHSFVLFFLSLYSSNFVLFFDD